MGPLLLLLLLLLPPRGVTDGGRGSQDGRPAGAAAGGSGGDGAEVARGGRCPVPLPPPFSPLPPLVRSREGSGELGAAAQVRRAAAGAIYV